MQVLIGFIVNELLMNFCSSVDTSFSNRLSVDAVCVMSCYMTLSWIVHKCVSIGRNAFNVELKNAKLCLLITAVSGLLVGIAVAVFRVPLSYLWYLTDDQRVLLQECFLFLAVDAVLSSVYEFLYNYMVYCCSLRLVYGTNAVYYALLLLSDFVAVRVGGGLLALLACTLVCNCVYLGYSFILSGILKSVSEYSWTKVWELLKHGFNLMIDRVAGRLGLVFTQIYASKLGTDLFAIHGVCFSVMVLLESYTNGLYTFVRKKLAMVTVVRRKMVVLKRILKVYTPIVGIAIELTVLPALAILHGAVSFKECVPFVFLMSTEVLTLLCFEPCAASLLTCGATGVLRFNGIISLGVRLILAPAVLYGGFGLIGFVLIEPIDVVCKTTYNGIMFQRVCRREYLQ